MRTMNNQPDTPSAGPSGEKFDPGKAYHDLMARIDSAGERIATLVEERDQATADLTCALEQFECEVERGRVYKAENAHLRGALKVYGHHKPQCVAAKMTGGCAFISQGCTCGLATALAPGDPPDEERTWVCEGCDAENIKPDPNSPGQHWRMVPPHSHPNLCGPVVEVRP